MNSKGAGGGGVCIEKSIRGGGGGRGSELSDQLLDPDVPTLASQDKLKVSPKGLPFVTRKQGYERSDRTLRTGLLALLLVDERSKKLRTEQRAFRFLGGKMRDACRQDERTSGRAASRTSSWRLSRSHQPLGPSPGEPALCSWEEEGSDGYSKDSKTGSVIGTVPGRVPLHSPPNGSSRLLSLFLSFLVRKGVFQKSTCVGCQCAPHCKSNISPRELQKEKDRGLKKANS